jgi:hypothetical protein
MSNDALEIILEELQEIKLLYKELLEKFICTEEPTEEEKKAIAEKDNVASEEELLEILWLNENLC